jgi:hypothetical protein
MMQITIKKNLPITLDDEFLFHKYRRPSHSFSIKTYNVELATNTNWEK